MRCLLILSIIVITGFKWSYGQGVADSSRIGTIVPGIDTIPAQRDTISRKALADSTRTDTVYTLRDDTLFSNKGFNIYVGQRLIAGKGSGSDGLYHTISFKSAFALPLWIARESELQNQYHNDAAARDADKVKQYLAPGASLYVKRIQEKGKRKKWHYYQVFLWNGTSSLAMKYRCDIGRALSLKEVTLQ